MLIYTVHAPPADRPDAADPTRFAFIKEGFCWPALFFPGLWNLFRGLWLVLLAFLLVSVGLGALADQVGGPLPNVVLVAAWLLFAVEANGLRRWTLERRGWRLIGVAEGRRLREAELRFFSAFIATGAAMPSAAPQPPAPPSGARAAGPGEVVGLFPTSGAAS